MNSSAFGKTIKIVWKHRNIKLINNVERRHYAVSEPNFSKKWFSEKLTVIKRKKHKSR